MNVRKERVTAICKLFEACRYRHDLYTLFSDCIEACAITISNAVDLRQREARERRYLEIVARYDSAVIETFARILGEITLALEEEPADVLGAVFHALELHNDHRGQFFTPDNIARMMAMMLQLGDGAELRTTVERKGYVSAHEPACGAGVMIIQLANAMRDHGLNYQRQLHVTAIDIDRRAVHMAYVQFSLLYIPAIVIVGDTLRLTEHEHWHTPAHILDGWAFRVAEHRRRDAAVQAEEIERQAPVAALPALEPPAPARRRNADTEAQLTLF